jgi:hypothetical protein
MRRWTETDKWRDQWFMQLRGPAKLAMIYLWDNCDHAGVWEPNLDLASFQLRLDPTMDWKGFLDEVNRPVAMITPDEVAATGNTPIQVQVLPNGRWWVTKFIIYQYGWTLHDDDTRNGKFHTPVFKALRRHGLYAAWRKMFPRVVVLGAGAKFEAPTLDEVEQHVKQTEPGCDLSLARMFFHHYQVKGWKLNGQFPEAGWLDLWEKWLATHHLKAKAPARPQKRGLLDVKDQIAAINREIAQLQEQKYRPTGKFFDEIRPEARERIAELKQRRSILEAQLRGEVPDEDAGADTTG